MTMLPHGPLIRLEHNLWMVEGAAPRGPIGRKMVIVRTDEGTLFVHNAVEVSSEVKAEIDGLGPVRVIFTPSPFHDRDGQRMHRLYPDAQLCAMPGALAKLARKWPEIRAFDASWALPPIRITPVPGMKFDEPVMEVDHDHGSSVTQVYCDTFFNLAHQGGMSGLILRLLGSSGGFKVTRIAKTFLVDDRRALRRYITAQIARTDIKRVVVAHGSTIEDGIGAHYEGALAGL